MGLFAKKKAALERKKEASTHEIVCLYCFRNFAHDRVLFRALEALDAEGYHAAPDELLDHYRARFGLPSAGEMPVALAPDDFGEGARTYHRGVLSQLTDDYKNTTSRRICPHCHNDLPAQAGYAPSTIISVVGASQAGKSVYLTALLHVLKTVTPRGFPIFCTPITGEMGRKFKLEYEDPLVERGLLLASTQKEKVQEPFIFTFSFTDTNLPEINVAFFDVAGEGLVDTAYMDIYAAHVRNSSGILFLADPVQFRAVGAKINLLNNISGGDTYFAEPTEVLSGLVEDYIYKQGGGTSDVPTAIVLTKTDLLEAVAETGEYVRPQANMFKNFTHRSFFNVGEFKKIDAEVQDFIADADPNFRNALLRRFSRVGFFAVSALGSKPVDGRVASFAPMRVDEPFLWLLWQLGYIESVE
jgi:hypothetical protein